MPSTALFQLGSVWDYARGRQQKSCPAPQGAFQSVRTTSLYDLNNPRWDTVFARSRPHEFSRPLVTDYSGAPMAYDTLSIYTFSSILSQNTHNKSDIRNVVFATYASSGAVGRNSLVPPLSLKNLPQHFRSYTASDTTDLVRFWWVA